MDTLIVLYAGWWSYFKLHFVLSTILFHKMQPWWHWLDLHDLSVQAEYWSNFFNYGIIWNGKKYSLSNVKNFMIHGMDPNSYENNSRKNSSNDRKSSNGKKKCNMKWQNHFQICKWILFAISSFTIIEEIASGNRLEIH